MRKEDIVKLGDKDANILRMVCVPIEDFEDKSLNNILREMQKFVEDKENLAVGLALPQLGIAKRGFVMRNRHGNSIVMLNPKILDRGHIVKFATEICLSEPGIEKFVMRYEKITIRFHVIGGEKLKLTFEGFEARIIQHEMEHLEGKLLSDK